MRRTVTGLFIFVFLILAARQAAAQDQIRDLVVKIHATQQAPDLLRPWTRSARTTRRWTGP